MKRDSAVNRIGFSSMWVSHKKRELRSRTGRFFQTRVDADADLWGSIYHTYVDAGACPLAETSAFCQILKKGER